MSVLRQIQRLQLYMQLPRRRLMLLSLLIIAMAWGAQRTPVVDIVVATKPLLAQTVLQSQHLHVRRLDQRFVPGGAVEAAELPLVIGEVLQRPLAAGEALSWSAMPGAQAQPSEDIPNGMRLIVVNPDNYTALLPFLAAHDHVDLLFSNNKEPTAGQSATKVLLQAARLYHLDQTVQESDSQSVIAPGAGVGLIVSPQQAALVLQAQSQGTLRLALRNPNDQQLLAARIAQDDLTRCLERRPRTAPHIEIIYNAP